MAERTASAVDTNYFEIGKDELPKIIRPWLIYDPDAAQIIADDMDGINLRTYLREPPSDFVLENGRVVRAGLLDAATFFEDFEKRHVATTIVHEGDDENAPVRVSTVFLTHDHGIFYNNDPDYRPLVFESMIFGGEFHDWQERYSTLEEAKAGHERLVEKARRTRR